MAAGPMKTPRQRKREQRQRDKVGAKPVSTKPQYNRLCEALIVSTRLPEADALDDEKVADAATAILNEWAKLWIE